MISHMRNTRSRSMVPSPTVLVWLGEKDAKKASVNENTLLCFLRDLKGGLLKTHYVWYA